MGIDEEEVSVTFEGDEVIVNGEAVSEAKPAAAVVSGEAVAEAASAPASSASDETAEEPASEGVAAEAIIPASVEVNGAPVGVTFDGTVALVNGQPVIATEEGSTVVIDGEEVSVPA